MIIVDSTVIIDIWRGRPNVKSVLKPYSNQTIYISAITLAVIYDGKEDFGILLHKISTCLANI